MDDSVNKAQFYLMQEILLGENDGLWINKQKVMEYGGLSKISQNYSMTGAKFETVCFWSEINAPSFLYSLSRIVCF